MHHLLAFQYAASRNDFENNEITSEEVLKWMNLFCDEFAASFINKSSSPEDTCFSISLC